MWILAFQLCIFIQSFLSKFFFNVLFRPVGVIFLHIGVGLHSTPIVLWPSLCITWPSLEAVSYTHLDVYKRQNYKSLTQPRVNVLCRGENLKFLKFSARYSVLNFDLTMWPQGTTHISIMRPVRRLDVSIFFRGRYTQ